MPENLSCHIGTSGWYYQHWRGPFYPKDFPEKEFLAFYSNHFNSVEINNSFYKLPDKKTLKQWRHTVRDDFIFAVKASRYMTHMKKLKEPRKGLSNFLNTIGNLDDKLGPVLFQLPPNWHRNTKRLEAFLAELPSKHRYAFEFRNRTWFDESVYKLLLEYNAAFCLYDLEGKTSPEIVTAEFVYIRLHGPSDAAYQGSYSNRQLTIWAGKFHKWLEENRKIYCFFDNDQRGYAAKNALTLQHIVNS
jgi:uncharacterized protein YecE (DUF72 family)